MAISITDTSSKTVRLSPSRASATLPVRQRKIHKKSRAGCRNCKLRRVKCDESQPSCNNCDRFMVTCNYDRAQPDLEPVYPARNTVASQIPILNPVSINVAVIGMINNTLKLNYPHEYRPLRIDFSDLELLQRWQNRTAWTIGMPATAAVYQREMIKIVARYPYLMHAILALTIKHDRCLAPAGTKDAQRQALEYLHYGRAAALLSQRLQDLSGSSVASQDDALWGTAVFLGALSISSLEGNSPEEVWPLKDGTPGEALSWIRTQDGIKTIWYYAQPFAPGRLFHDLLGHPEHTWMLNKLKPDFKVTNAEMPAGFSKLCSVDMSTAMGSNPYSTAARAVCSLLDLAYRDQHALKFLNFTATMDPEYKKLLAEKDPPALVILAWWYAFMADGTWYMANRARLECASICIYLGRKHPENRLLQKMLTFPRYRMGMLSKGGKAALGEDDKSVNSSWGDYVPLDGPWKVEHEYLPSSSRRYLPIKINIPKAKLDTHTPNIT